MRDARLRPLEPARLLLRGALVAFVPAWLIVTALLVEVDAPAPGEVEVVADGVSSLARVAVAALRAGLGLALVVLLALPLGALVAARRRPARAALDDEDLALLAREVDGAPVHARVVRADDRQQPAS